MYLKPGDSGPQVYELNSILGALHYYDPKVGYVFLLYSPASESDFFSAQTTEAVIQFKRLVTWGTIPLKGQYTFDLTSPIVDDPTWNALQEWMKEWTLKQVEVTAKRDKDKKWVLPVLLGALILMGSK